MCGRFNQRLSPAQWAEVFDTLRMPQTEYESLQTRYNTAPMQATAAIRSGTEGPELATLQWKLIPAWSKTRAIKFNTINAKAETIETSGTYRTPFRRRRCLIPAAGFYEWPKPNSREFDDKKPFYIYLTDHRPMCFAAIWDRWEKSDPAIDSFSIITVAANQMMATFHDRMPAILKTRDWNVWLDTEIEDTDLLQSLLQPRAEDDLMKRRVGNYVNDWRNEGANCLQE